MRVLIKGPIRPVKGDGYRVYTLVSQLKKYCELVLLNENKNTSNLKEYRELFRTTYSYNPLRFSNTSFGSFYADLNPSYWSTILKIIKKEQPDIIQVTHNPGVLSAKMIARMEKAGTKVVCDLHNVESDMVGIYKTKDYSLIKKEALASSIPLLERFSTSLADHIITVSEVDRKRFIEFYGIPSNKITTIPIGTELPNLSKLDKKYKNTQNLQVIFHGSYNHPPNREAVDIIRKKIAPIFEQEDVLFLLAGKDMPKFKEKNVVSLGYVEDLSELIASCDIAIVPILRGGGMRTKIIDYMKFAKPIVTTKKGIEGIDAENRKHAIIVDNVNEEFIEAIDYLIENEEERQRLGRNARKLAKEKYDSQKIGEKLYRLYEKITNK